MSGSDSGVDVQVIESASGDVVVFTVRGRTRINLVGHAVLQQLVDELNAAARSADLRCALLQGHGEAAFIGGADLDELAALDSENAASFVGAIHDVCSAIREFPVPVIARISGYCLGGGLEIAAACDFRVADRSATFGMPEVKVGVPSVVEAALLPQLVGWGKARELVYRGHLVDGDEAYRIGLVEELAEEGEIDDLVALAVNDILEAAPNAIRLQKELCRVWEMADIETAISAGLESFAAAYQGDEPQRYIEEFFRRNRARKRGSD